MLKNQSNIPNLVSYLALNMTRGSLEKKCGHDVLSCSPLSAVTWITTPCMFIIGDKDELVQFDKFNEMVQACKAYPKKLIVEPDAGHPDSRSEEAMDQAFEFFNKLSKIVEKEEEVDDLKDILDSGANDEALEVSGKEGVKENVSNVELKKTGNDKKQKDSEESKEKKLDY